MRVFQLVYASKMLFSFAIRTDLSFMLVLMVFQFVLKRNLISEKYVETENSYLLEYLSYSCVPVVAVKVSVKDAPSSKHLQATRYT